VRAEDVERQRRDDLSGIVRVTEGETGRIEMGQTVPFQTSNGVHGTNTQFVTAANGFEARPRILGDGRVQVDLAPFAGRFTRGGRIEQGSASTVVTVTPGETIVVGGLTQSSTDSRTDLLSGSRESRREDDTVLVLRVDVE
jgi:type II secretory pathway component HofQ